MAALSRVSRVVVSSCFVLGSALLAAQAPIPATHAARKPVTQTLPLVFENNQGQFPSDVAFVGRTDRYSVALGSQDVRFLLPAKHGSSKVVLSLKGSEGARPVGLAEAPFRTNYYIGSRPSDYRLGIRNYDRVGMTAVYPGIDVQFYATGNTIEHDFLVAPGADASQIAMGLSTEGKAASLNAAGDLVVKGDEGELRLEKPVAYQVDLDGKRHAVPATFVLASAGGKRELSFQLGDYDHTRQLVIDPVIQYASFFDTASGSTATSLASDPSGNTYLTGYSSSAASGFGILVPYVPPGVLALPGTKTGPAVFLVKFSPVASTPTVAWMDYYSGTTDTLANAVALQPGTTPGTVAVGGYTTATDLPGVLPGSVTGAAQRGFVASFSTLAGTLNGAAYIDSNTTGQTSSSTIVNALALDTAATPNIYAVGTANGGGLPATTNALSVDGGVVSGTSYKGFVYELTSTLTTGGFVSYVAGNAGAATTLTGVAVDGSGDVFVGGYTAGNFPEAVTPGAMNTHNGTDTLGNDSFVAEIAPGTPYTLLYSTWLSGSGDDRLTSIALDASTPANLYAFGQTASTDLFSGTDASYTYSGGTPVPTPTPGLAGSPVTGTFPMKTTAGTFSGFTVKLDPTGKPLVGTYLGAAGNDVVTSGIVDPNSNLVYAGGYSSSVSGMSYGAAVMLPTNEDNTSTSLQRGFVLQLANDLSAVNFVANFGGTTGPDSVAAIALDSTSNVYVGGNIKSASAYTSSNASQPSRTSPAGTANPPAAYFATINPSVTGDPGFTLMAVPCASAGMQPNSPVGCPDPLDFMSAKSATYTFNLSPESTTPIPAANVPINVQITGSIAGPVMQFSNCMVTDLDATGGSAVIVANGCPTSSNTFTINIPVYPSTSVGLVPATITLHHLQLTFLGTLQSEPMGSPLTVMTTVQSSVAPATANATLVATENSNIAPVLAIIGSVTSPAAGGQVFTTNILPASAPATTQVSYAFTITNNGGGPATGATFTLPSTSASGGFVVGTVSATGPATAGTSSCTAAANGCSGLTLNYGESAVVTVTGTYLDSALGMSATVPAPNFPVSAKAVSGSADAITTNPSYTLAPGTASGGFAGITLARGVHLTLGTATITGQRADGNFYLGDTVTYNVPVNNAGPSTSHGTEPVKFTLPAGFTPNSSNCTTSPCSPAAPAIGANGTATVTITGSFADSSANAGIGAATSENFSAAVSLDTTYDVDSNPGVGTLSLSSTTKVERNAPLSISSPVITLPATVCAGGGSCLYMLNSGVKDSAGYSFTVNNGGPNVSVNTVFTITLPSAPVNPAGTYHALISGVPSPTTNAVGSASNFGAAIACVRNNTSSNATPASNTLTCTGNLPSGSFTVTGMLTADSGTVPPAATFVNTSTGTLGSAVVAQNATINSLPGAQTLPAIEIDRAAHLVTTTAAAATGTTPSTPINLDETATATPGVDDTVTVTINVGNTALNAASGTLTASLPQYFRLTAIPTVASTTAGTTVSACTLPAGYTVNSTTTATPPSFTCNITAIAPGSATPSNGATPASNPAPQIKVTYSGKFLDNGTGVDITNSPAGSATKVASLTAALGTATAAVQYAVDPYAGTTDATSSPSVAVQRLVHMYLSKTRNTSVAAAPAGFADTTDPNLDEKKSSGFGVNDEIEYDVAVANGGANKALGVQFSDMLPPYFTLVNTYLISPAKTTNPDSGSAPAGQLAGSLACYLGSTTTGTPLTTPLSTNGGGQMITCTYGTSTAPLALSSGAAVAGDFHNAASIELVYQGKFQDNAPGVDNIPAGVSTYSVTSNANDAFVSASFAVDNGTAADRSSTALAAYKIQRAAHLMLVTPTVPLTDLSGNMLTKAADGTSVAAEGQPSTVSGSNPVINCVRYKIYVQNVGPNVARSPMLSATLPGGLKLVGTPVSTTTSPNSDTPQSDTCSYGGGASPAVSGSALTPTSESAGSSLVVDLDGYFNVGTLTNVNSLGGVALTYSALSDGTAAAPSSMDSGGTAFVATRGTALTVVNTPYGSNFSLAPFSGTATQPVALTFGSVGIPGITSLGIASTTTAALPKGQSPLPGASATAISLYKSGTAPQFYSLGSTATTITGNTGVCVTNAVAGMALADGFAKPERVLLWDLANLPAGTMLGGVPNVAAGDITSSVLALGGVAYVQAGGPLDPYSSTNTTLPPKQAQPLKICGNLNGFATAAAQATLAVLEPVNFAPVITANPNSPTQTPGKGVSEVTFLFPSAYDYNNADPCYVATMTGGAASRSTCDDNKVLTTRIYGGTALVPSQPYEIGPMTPDVTANFVATTFEVQAGQNLYDFVTDQLSEVTYLATNSCDPTGNPSSNPCPATAANLTMNLQQETLFTSADIALLTPSVNGGSSALIIIPQGANPSSNSTTVLGGAAQATATVNAGQTVGFLWRLRLDTGTTTGTYNLTCFGVDAATQTIMQALPAGLTCQIPATVTLPTDIPVYIVTQGGLYAHNSPGWKVLGGTVFAGLFLPFLLFRRRLSYPRQLVLMGLFMLLGAAGLSGCGSGNNGMSGANTVSVPAGTYWFRLSATPTAGGAKTYSTAFSVKVVSGS